MFNFININIKRFLPVIVILIGVSFYSSNDSTISNYAITKVVIDAGHGGHDPGCSSKHVKEKDVALSIALKLGTYIEKNIKGVKVIYTRNTDVFVELFRRAQIANENNADLFISIHCNASKSSEPYGMETYVMGLHKSGGNIHVAETENAAILLETDYKNQYNGFDVNKGFDPNSTEFFISYQLYQKAYLDHSLLFASNVQTQFEEKLGRFNRGVKQAGFLVLWRTTMPGVLIEAGFLSNTNDEALLRTEKGQDQVAQSIFRAFRSYKSKVEGSAVIDSPVTPLKEYKDEPVAVDSISIATVAPVHDTIKHKLVEVAKPKLTETVKPTASEIVKTVAKPLEAPSPDTVRKIVLKPVDDTLVFKIQLATASDLNAIKKSPYDKLPKIGYYKQDAQYKITVGHEKVYADAVALQTKMRSQGFKDAFLICFYYGKRISIQEALVKIKK